MRYVLALLALAGVVALFGSPAARAGAAPTDLVRVYITLPGPPLPSDATAVRSLGGRTRHSFPDLNTVSVELPEVALPALQQLDRVLSVRPVPRVEAFEDTTDWGVKKINAPNVWGGSNSAVNVATATLSGAGVKVAVVDTGSGPHSDLNVAGRVQCITPSTTSGGCSTSGTVNDDAGHGTHVAGTIAAQDNGSYMLGVAPGVSLYSVKVLDSSGSGYMDDVAAGVDWSRQNGIQVVSMSLGCYSSLNPSACDDPVLHSAITNAYNAGVILVAAAGNNGTCAGTGDQVGYPARYDEVIAVSATDSSNASPCFSSVGPKVELAAPGVSITSDKMGGGTTVMSGTSMATPHVSGVAALVKGCNPGLSNVQVRSILDASVIDLGTAGRDTWYGYGLVQANAAVAAAGPCSGVSTKDTTAPSVVSVSPAAGATGVSVNSSVSATFSEAMNAATITSSSFSLSVSGAAVAGSVSYDSGSHVATFKPSAALAGGQTYSAKVTAAVTDTAGNAMTAAYSWSFTTAVPAPTCTAPVIVSHSDTIPSGGGSVSFSWSPVEGASQYTVQRNWFGSWWFTIATTAATSVSNLTDGVSDPNWRVFVSSGGCTPLPGPATVFDP